MPTRHPHLRIHDDGAIEPDHRDFLPIRSRRRVAHHVLPPCFLDVALQFDAEWAVVPETVDSAVNFARLEDEPTPSAQGHELFHVHCKPRSTRFRYFNQWLLTMPTAPISTRSGSRRTSGTTAN